MKPAFPRPRREILLDCLLVFALTAALIWPLFKAKYLARVVDLSAVGRLQPVTTEQDDAGIRAYVAAIEGGPDSPAMTAWERIGALRVRATLNAAQVRLVQMSYDPAWHAYSSGRPLNIPKDALGQMLIEAPPGEHDIRLVFELPLENRVGRILTAAAVVALISLLAAGLRRKEDPA